MKLILNVHISLNFKGTPTATFTKKQHMLKRCLFAAFFLMLSGSVFAYDYLSIAPKKKKKKSGFDKERILIGPGLNFGAAQQAFFFSISPSVGYAFTDHVYAGVTTTFSYYQFSQAEYNVITNQTEIFKYKMPIYSASIYVRPMIGNFLIFNFEPEINNVKYFEIPYPDPVTKKLKADSYRKNILSCLVGVGYMQRFGKYSHSYLMANYDLVQNPNSRYYGTLDIRAGIMLSLFNY